jgi:DNA polymerase
MPSAEEIKTAWREAHPSIVSYWYGLEDRAQSAVRHPGQVFSKGDQGRAVSFLVKGSFLFCKLPSGRVLTYPYPKLKPITTPWGEEKEQVHYMSVDGKTRKWQETHTYGGKLAENVTQAVSRDILADAMLRVEKHGFPIVMHVHDEIVVEVEEFRRWDLSLFEAHVMQVPSWAAGLPIAVEGWRGRRYRK